MNSTKNQFIIYILLIILSCKNTKKDDGYKNLYNGKNMDNWNIMCRDKTDGLAEKVFTAGENGEMLVFKDIPDEYAFE